MQRLIYLFLLFSIGIEAQEITFNQIEAQSLKLYEKSDWNGLILLDQSIQNQGVDYYYYNVRIGVAYFSLKDYYGAEKYFTKALNNNTTDFVLEYLYWTYINLGQINQAKEIHEKLSDEVRKKIPNGVKFIESVYLEGGVKFSNNKLRGNLEYASISIAHRVNHKLTFVSGVGAIIQKSKNESVDQLQYNIFPSYYLKNGYSVNAGFMYAYNKFIRDSRIDSKTVIGQTVNNHTDANINNLAYHASVSKQHKRLYAELYGYYLTQSLKGKRTNIYESTTDKISSYTYILGANLCYTLPVLNNRFSIGSWIFTANDSDTNNFLLSPYIVAKVTPDVWIKMTYYDVKKTLFVDKDAGIFFTNNHLNIQRVATTATWALSKKWQIVGTYSHENIKGDFANPDLNLNSYFVGVNYNL